MNSKAVRYFVIAEVLACFVPLTAYLFLGFLFAPFALLEILEGRFGGWIYLAAVVCGVAGLIALVQVLSWLFGRQTYLLGRWWTLTLMLLGLLPVVAGFSDTLFDGRRHPWYMMPVWAAPILVTAHLAYLARQYLFTSSECRVKH